MEIKTEEWEGWLVATPAATSFRNPDGVELKDSFIKELQTRKKNVVLDCSRVQYADSRFIGNLLAMNIVLEREKAEFVLIIKANFLKQLFANTNLDRLLKIFHSLKEFKEYARSLKTPWTQ